MLWSLVVKVESGLEWILKKAYEDVQNNMALQGATKHMWLIYEVRGCKARNSP